MTIKELVMKDLKRFKEAIRAWRAYKNETDKDMIKGYIKDRKDLTRVLSLTQKGEFAMAGDVLWNLDTIVRDQVPARIYNFLMKESGKF